jgi:N-acetylneuraminic acid mutarotase
MSTVNEPSQRSDSVFAWTGTELILWGGYNFFVSGYALGDGARYNPITNTWSTISSLAAPSARFNHAGVWTGTQLIIMGGQAPYVPSVPTVVLDDASSYDPATNGWSPIVMPQSPPTAREHVATVWTGTEWIIYGGASSYSPMNGSRFNPASQTWTPLPDGGPAGRTNPSAVWTGSELLVFGGSISSVAYDDVWKWSPTTNTWTSTSPPTRPSARYSASAVWTGTEMIIYAGRAAAGTALSDGWRFNPVTNTWTVIATHPSLTARVDHFAAWTGTEMLIYGGSGVGGGFYNPVTNNWRIISYIDAVYGATVWTGTELIVWGGEGITASNIGARYNPDTQVWTPLPLTGAPSARYGHTLVWDGQRAYVWGGDVNISDDTTKSDGAVYDPSTDAWTPLPAEGAPLARSAHYAVWTGDQLLIWGGETDIGGHSLLDDLAALKPSTSRWFYVKQ